MSKRISPLRSFRPSPVGGIGYELILSAAEISMLRLLLAPDDEAFVYWEKFWQEIADYEDAPFGCKELMPLAVRKMQRAVDPSVWQSVAPSQATFLAGLPKYTWTKNRIIFQQFQALTSQLVAIGVPVMAIKGMAEMLRDPEVMFMRTSRDIDLVIQPKDLEASVQLLQSMGWYSEQVARGIPSPLSEFEGNSFTFDHPDHFISLDIHFDAVSDSRGAHMKFTQELWSTRKTFPGFEGFLSIPSLKNQFCLFLANAFVPDNWSTGLVNKYLYDLLRQLQGMDQLEKKKAQEQAQEFLEMGDYAHQMINLSRNIDPLSIPIATSTISSDSIGIQNKLRYGLSVSEAHYYKYWHLHNFYRDMKQRLIPKYGYLLSYSWMMAHFVFHLRVVQVCYWHLITWKDQALERIRYYFGRIVFYRKQYSFIYLMRKLFNGLIGKVDKLILNISPAVTSAPPSQVEIISNNSVQYSSQESQDGQLVNVGTPFPPGMRRFFYFSFKLLKI